MGIAPAHVQQCHIGPLRAQCGTTGESRRGARATGEGAYGYVFLDCDDGLTPVGRHGAAVLVLARVALALAGIITADPGVGVRLLTNTGSTVVTRVAGEGRRSRGRR